MKKVLLMALVILAGATCCPASAAKKDKKKKKAKQEEVTDTVVVDSAAAIFVRPDAPIITRADSIGYVSGMVVTQGLLPYLKGQYHLNENYLQDFLRGFYTAVQNDTLPDFRAYQVGTQIAEMTLQRVIPTMMNDYPKTELNREMFFQGFMDAVMGDHKHFNDSVATVLKDKYVTEAKEAAFGEWKRQNEAFLFTYAQNDSVTKTADGLLYKVIRQGKGERPTRADKVVVKYEGKLIDGTVFDSSYTRNPQTSTFGVTQVIKGWTEALLLMPVGSKWELCIPQELGYGPRETGKIKSFSTLIFTVELEEIKK